MSIDVTRTDEYYADESAGTGCLRTTKGNLPLHKLAVRATVTGLVARSEVVQGFANPYDVPLEATYVFPLPDRAAVTSMTMTADGRTIVAELHERARARADYDAAIASGHRAAIVEEDRPDVFTMRVGNIAAGERVEITLSFTGPLPFEDGEAMLRVPLVVAPRYIPGRPLPGGQAGDGYARDTDRTPDASRITPPVLLPGFPNPIDLSVEVVLDPAGLPVGAVRSSLHAVTVDGGSVRLQPGERVNRDFVLRIPYGDASGPATALVACPDGDEGTFELTVVAPNDTRQARGKDVVLLLDRSGSMSGWKMVAARRAAARIIDTLGTGDRLAVLTFDDRIERPADLPHDLVAGTDRHRYRAVEHLSRAQARGGTELLGPLVTALRMLESSGRERDAVVVLITDGQVGNEDEILHATVPLMSAVRLHAIGIDQAVNAGFLARLAAAGGGRCELVESEDRLDDAMDSIHRRIAAPLVTGLRVAGAGVIENSISPARLPDLFPGVPLVIRGRYRGAAPALTLSGRPGDEAPWQTTVHPTLTADPAVTHVWARAAVRDLEDAYAVAPDRDLEQQIVATSLRFGVLCRFTAFVAVDVRTVNEGGALHRVVQPVELPAGWADAWATPMASEYSLIAHSAAGLAGAPRMMRASAVAAEACADGAGRPFRAARARGRASVTGGRGSTGDVLATARAMAVTEADRLRQEGGSHLRDLLDDLATRLDALVRQLESAGIDAASLREISRLLRDGNVSAADRANRAHRALLAFAGSDASRSAFWKQS